MINRIKIVIDEKAEEWGRPLPQKTVAAEADIDPGTLSRYINNRVGSFDMNILGRLCEFLDVELTDLFHIEKTGKSGKPSLS